MHESKSAFYDEYEDKDKTSAVVVPEKPEYGIKVEVETEKYGISKPVRKTIRARTISSES